MDKSTGSTPTDYALDEQVGFLLRRATQRHLAIFARQIPTLTSTQFAALAKLYQLVRPEYRFQAASLSI